MPRYLSLISFTDKGIAAVKNSIQRATAFRAHVKESGGKVEALYWAIGESDGAVIFQAPDETTATALLLKLAEEGFVRTKTSRLFDETEFSSILERA